MKRNGLMVEPMAYKNSREGTERRRSYYAWRIYAELLVRRRRCARVVHVMGSQPQSRVTPIWLATNVLVYHS